MGLAARGGLIRSRVAVPSATPVRGHVAGLTLEGCGVLRPEGKRVLVPDALPGEEIDYVVARRHPRYDEGRLVAVAVPSVDRVAPACEYFGRCGGCVLQHLAPAAQLAAKEQALLETLARIGGVRPARVLPATAGSAWGYRRRARLAARDVAGKGRVLVGFHERARPYVMDMGSCATAHPAISALLVPLSELAGALSFRARLPQFEVTVADNAVAVVIRALQAPTAADRAMLAAFAARPAADGRPVWLYLQTGNAANLEAVGADTGTLHYSLAGEDLRLQFGPTDFIQVHAGVNAALIATALAELAPGPADRVLDCFAGIGNFSLPLARRAGHVVGLEGAGSAVEWARRNAAAAGLANVEFAVADLAGAGVAGAWTRERFRLALLDPPRAGARELLAPLAATGVERLVYVSCHPGTLARDAGILVTGHGFELAAAGVFDMFPHTSHVESLAVFTRGRAA